MEDEDPRSSENLQTHNQLIRYDTIYLLQTALIYLFQTALIYIKHMYMYYVILKQQCVKVTRTCLGRDQKTNIDKYGITQQY